MIIYGYRNRKIDVATGAFQCPRCQAQRIFKRQRIDRYFTLFFIPLFRLGRVGEYVECQTCFTTYKPEILANSFLGGDIASNAGPEPLSTLTPPPKSNRPGWLLAILGAGMFLCGGLLGASMLVLQWMGAAGPTDNLEGFIGLMILCPTPLVVFGVVMLVIGVVLLRRNQEQQEQTLS